jgi:signal transduction histidine kinase
LGAIGAVVVAAVAATGLVRTRARVHAAAIASLGNYATVASEQFVNGVESLLRQSFAPILPPPGYFDSASRDPLPVAELLEMIERLKNDPCHCHLAPSPTAVFRVALDHADTEVVDSLGRSLPRLDSAVVATLRLQADSLQRVGWRYGYTTAATEGGTQFVFFTVRSDSAMGHRYAYGFATSAATVAERILSSAFRSIRLVPRHLLASVSSNEAFVTIQVEAASGEVIYTSPRRYPDGARDALEMPALRGAMTVTAFLNPQLKSALIPGGVPARVPTWELALLALSLTLLLAIAALGLRAAELARLRSDFASSVTHELRTPLTQIRLAAETMLLGRATKPGAAERSLASIVGETNRLQHLIDNVLHFSRAERRMTRLAKEPVELAALLQRIADDFLPLVSHRAIAIVVTAADDLRVTADPNGLRQIVLNLLDNAARYGPDGQTITVGADRRPDGVRIWVADQGAGITVAERARVWRPFVRLADAADAATGTGLGLAVVRELTEAHGGRCWIEDQAGGGIRVVVALP